MNRNGIFIESLKFLSAKFHLWFIGCYGRKYLFKIPYHGIESETMKLWSKFPHNTASMLATITDQ